MTAKYERLDGSLNSQHGARSRRVLHVNELPAAAELAGRDIVLNTTPRPICSASMTFAINPSYEPTDFPRSVPPKYQRLQRQDNRLHTKDQRVNEGHRIDHVQIDKLQRADILRLKQLMVV